MCFQTKHNLNIETAFKHKFHQIKDPMKLTRSILELVLEGHE
jgi:hypothetical protein